MSVSNLSASPRFRGDLQLIAAPSGDVVTLTEMKRHLKVDDSARDDDITAFIAAAVEFVQADTRRQLLTASWRLNLRSWATVIEMPKAPVSAITSITYTDSNGDSQTLDSARYQAMLYSEPAMVRPQWGYSWPTIRPVEAAIQVNFTAGYGLAAAVPSALKSAIKLLVEGWFYGQEGDVSTAVEQLLSRYKWESM